jgi:outer membrane receptor protein involved in Fe transport
VRVVQFIDGMDNQAPGLNFPVGNLVGATDLDLQSVEIITGPASALYGPNAFQGVVSMTTRNPYDFQGLSVQLKTGTRNLMDG